MQEVHTMMMSLTIYKIVTIFAGLAFAFMGYRLFISGVFTEAGELRTNWDNRRLVLSKAAPGTFFALFGAVITCVSLWRGLSFAPLTRAGDIVGTGMFGPGPSTVSRHGGQDSGAEKLRPTVLEDIARLNRISNDLERPAGESPWLTTPVEDRKRTLELFERAKAALMLSVWSRDWGNAEEFRKWASGVEGYVYSEPPTSIAPAASIYKGDVR